MQVVKFARYVGVAPGTTTIRTDDNPGGAMLGAVQTQAVWEPDPNSDTVRLAVPPNQWVTGPATMKISMPAHQRNFGPVPNDGQLALTRPYQPYHKGWIEPSSGDSIYTLQGLLGQEPSNTEDTARKWAIAASIIGSIALATTTVIAVVQFRRGK
jgi:hypothetical protein